MASRFSQISIVILFFKKERLRNNTFWYQAVLVLSVTFKENYKKAGAQIISGSSMIRSGKIQDLQTRKVCTCVWMQVLDISQYNAREFPTIYI